MRTKHYNTSELATVLGCSTGYVYQLLKEGRIKGHKHRTGKWLVPKDQEEVFALIRKGHIQPLYSRVFTLDRIAEAHTLLEQGGAGGKIILKII
mgnify:CR=1 FL=1